MLRTADDRAASPQGVGAGCGVEVALSYPFRTAPPSGPPRPEDAFGETLRNGPPGTSLAEALERHFPGAVPTRAYVGNETCERLVPSPRAIEAWIAWAVPSGQEVTLVLPPLGGEAQESALEGMRLLSEAPGAEVVANDWGTVHRLKTRYPGLRIVLGRLTHKMVRDPRIAEHFDSPRAPAAARAALCSSGELAPGFRALMDRYGIGRREIDPYLQPLEEEEWEGRSEKLSVHLPYQFVTMGRACLPGSMHRERGEKFLPGGPCRWECRRYAVEFRVPSPGDGGEGRHLLNLGNGWYHAVPPPILERVLARLPASRQADRIVLTVPAPGSSPW